MKNALLLPGPFELLEPIGSGGMAEVWRCRHLPTGSSVAIKIITGEEALQQDFLEAFRNEVRATAGLEHPNIVRPLDYGALTTRLDLPSGLRLRPGQPYLVMELMEGGSLREAPPFRSWDSLRLLLLVLLDALAHAHARGVVHLDLKPDNVLFSGSGAMDQLKLTDFGIAQALDRRELTDATGRRARSDAILRTLAESVIGTPSYMAPEQFTGSWRDYGPWTDLYALGCMTYELACGRPPFDGENMVRLAEAHWFAPMPPLSCPFPVPTGLEPWLKTLLEKAPQARFQRAADAAWALEQFEVLEPALIAPGPAPKDGPTLPAQEQPTVLVTQHHHQKVPLISLPEMHKRPVGAAHPPGGFDASLTAAPCYPPLPLSCQAPNRSALPPLLHGVGLELYGLRPVPLVARTLEREALWSALHEVFDQGQARAIVLQGPVGSGKSRLAEWACERAHELGAAQVLVAAHCPSAGAQDGLPGMLARFLRCIDLSRAQAVERTRAALQLQGVADAYEWEALTNFMVPALRPDPDSASVRRTRTQYLNMTAERHGALRRYLERLSDTRPVLLWLDDAQWGGEALRFTQALLHTQSIRRSRILVLLTVQEEALSERLLEASDLQHLLEMPSVRRLDVSLLGPEDHRRLVGELLGLEPGLAAQVAQRTAGNPLFAIQLVGDWVQRGMLTPTSRGFMLLEDVQLVLPDNIHQVWRTRLDRALHGLPPDAQPALELAALLGQRVMREEWQQACGLAGISLPHELLDVLLAHHLVRPLQGLEGGPALRLSNWTFVHGMLRESLEREAQEQGRWVQLHQHCADMLLERYGEGDWTFAERRGRHLVHARAWDDAARLLLTAAELRRSQSAYLEALELLELRGAVLQEWGHPAPSQEWAHGQLLRAKILLEQLRIDELEQELGALRQRLGDHPEGGLQASLLRLEGDITRYKGLYGRSEQLYQQALKLARLHLQSSEEAQCLRGLANVAWEQHDTARAETLYAQAQRLYHEQGDLYRLSASMAFLGHMAQQTGRNELACRWFEQAVSIARQHGFRSCIADGLRGLGRVALYRDQDYERARALFEEARRLLEEMGGHYSLPHCINELGELARAMGDLDRAEDLYQRAIRLTHKSAAGNWITPMLNLATVRLIRAKYPDALKLLLEYESAVLLSGRKRLLGGYYAAVALSAAGSGDWDTFDQKLEAAQFHLSSMRPVDEEDVWLLEQALSLASVEQQTPREARVREILEQLRGP